MIEPLDAANEEAYRQFVLESPEANYCHDLGWKNVFQAAYGKNPFYLLYREHAGGPVKGIASGFFLNNIFNCITLCCLPYLDLGGAIAESPEAESELLIALKESANSRKAILELRCRHSYRSLPVPKNIKVNMLLNLKGLDIENYWKGLPAKVRNQVRKAEKTGVSLKWGKGHNILDDFYRVFCLNMRDLGSPVHSQSLFENVLEHFPGAEVGVAYKDGKNIGGLVRILWKKTLVIPWASSLRQFRTFCPNNALYYDSIKFAFSKDCTEVDFGRSSKGAGTYKFKMQWGAKESPLYWYQFDKTGKLKEITSHLTEGKMALSAKIWAKLPLYWANRLGPFIRPSISA